MTKTAPQILELLAPARNADTAIAAIKAGADAVYIGASSHGARHAAANSVDDIARVADFAHIFRAKVFATVNTIIYDNELADVERLIGQLYRAGVDALIVQDLGVLRLDLPPIELHASTQCDIRDPRKARFLADAGFSRLVLARELSLKEIAEIHAAVPDTPLEAFIHGALCVSYSGDCRASFATTGRSANRGECSQVCRLPFDLVDDRGNILVKGKHLLSLRDLNRSSSIADMAAAGVNSFKIEGRLKDEAYVKNTVGSYSRLLDRLVAESDGRYVRQSVGRVSLGFSPSLDKAFNRGFTPYFLTGKASPRGMASIATPKAVGMKVGVVTQCRPKEITARLDCALANGDGLGYYNQSGIFTGFRLNRVEGSRLYPATPQSIPAGTVLYRNRDKEFDDTVASARTERTIDVEMVLRTVFGKEKADDLIVIELTDVRGCSVSVSARVELQEAVTPQKGPRRRILEKLGATLYRAVKIVDLADDRCFIPASALTALRREAVEALDRAARATYRFELRREEKPGLMLPEGYVATVHDNVANRLAREFYASHGAVRIESAAEVAGSVSGREPVMTTRYCLRKEMGKCLREASGKTWPANLCLVSGPTRLRVEFDCKACRMNLYHDSIKTR